MGYVNGTIEAEHNITVTVDAGTAPLESDFNDYVNDIIPLTLRMVHMAITGPPQGDGSEQLRISTMMVLDGIWRSK